jgi:tRNA dimethylallyltransferase
MIGRQSPDTIHKFSPILFIVGPTASGKTEISYLLAKELGAEIVSCDSMQVYREPSVITAKTPSFMLEAIKHHLIGIVSVENPYSVFDYYTKAREIIFSLHKRNIPIIVCGGSGLYAKALCDGVFEGSVNDEKLRKELNTRADNEGVDALHRELLAVDEEAALKIAKQDKRRIIRALEVYHTTGETISQKQKQAKGICDELDIRIFGLRLKRETLYSRINVRTEEMFETQAIDEVKMLRKRHLSITASKIIGISEIGFFLDGQISREQALELMKKNTRNFAKRQMTWFRKDNRIEWIDVDELSTQDTIKKILVKRDVRNNI